MMQLPRLRRISRSQWLLMLVTTILLLAQGALAAGHVRQGLLFVLLWLFPALLWSLWLQGPRVERFLSGAGLGLVVPVLLVLLASYLPGPLSPLMLAAVALMANLMPLIATVLHANTADKADDSPSWSSTALFALSLILFLSLLLRLVNIDYKEFQGDEGVIMVRAAQVLAGDELGLLRHQKGPVEILIPLIPWGLGGAVNELWARAPFVWAGLLSVLAVAAVGARLSQGSGGLLAALLYTIGGFSIAFSRIVQYQSFVILWSLLSVLHAFRYRHSGPLLDLTLTTVFLAAGLLAHYDAILFAPAIGLLIVGRWRQAPQRWYVHAVVAFLVGAAVVAAFYLPYLANPTFGGTGSYLLNDRIGGSLFSWSAPLVWRMSTFYNSTYYVLLLLFLAAVGTLAFKWPKGRMPAFLFVFVPLLFYTLVVADPRTHVYTVFPGLALMAGLGALALWRARRRRPRVVWPAAGLFALLFSLSLWYVLLLFVDVTPERQRTWPENRSPFFPTTWSEPPQYGLFGFPHQAGWRLAPALVTEMPYASNEEAEITDWYMAQAPRTHCPDYETFFVAARAQDALPYDEAEVSEMHLQTVVTVNDQPGLQIFDRHLDSMPAHSIEAKAHELWRAPQEVVPRQSVGDVPMNVTLGGEIKLLGYTLGQNAAKPGDTLDLVLYWQALVPIERNYQVFVHLFQGTMWAQDDSAPDCAMQPTSGWEPGQIVRDSHFLTLAPDTPATNIPLTVGLYDLITLDRLPIAETGEDAIRLTDVRVLGSRP